MKKIICLLGLFLFSVAIPAGFAQVQKGKQTVTFFVEEMECSNCQKRVEDNIAFEKGVTDLKCNLEDQTVEITYKKDKTTPEKLIKGFEKIKMTAVLADTVSVKK